MEIISSFNFSVKDELKSFFGYIFSNKDVKNIIVRIFFVGDVDFICGINPRSVSEDYEYAVEDSRYTERKESGELGELDPSVLLTRIPVCDHVSGKQIMELAIKKITKIEILTTKSEKREEEKECSSAQ